MTTVNQPAPGMALYKRIDDAKREGVALPSLLGEIGWVDGIDSVRYPIVEEIYWRWEVNKSYELCGGGPAGGSGNAIHAAVAVSANAVVATDVAVAMSAIAVVSNVVAGGGRRGSMAGRSGSRGPASQGR